VRPRIIEIALLIALLIAVVLATQAMPKRFKGQLVSTVNSGPIRDCDGGPVPPLRNPPCVRESY
jgi:hypothetical protein